MRDPFAAPGTGGRWPPSGRRRPRSRDARGRSTGPGADQVRQVEGYFDVLGTPQADLVLMTGNVAQVFFDDHEWDSTLRAIYAAHLVFKIATRTTGRGSGGTARPPTSGSTRPTGR